MATSTSITTTYAGSKAGGYIAQALLSANTLDNGGFTILQGVSEAGQVMKKFSQSGGFHDASCDFQAQGDVTLTEKKITPKRIHYNKEVCKEPFRNDWDAAEMGHTGWDVLPKSFADFLIAHALKVIAEKVENNIWTGDSSNDGEFDGINTLIAADANLPALQEIGGATVTSANVQAQLRLITAAIPDRLYGEPDLKIYVSRNIMQAYVESLGGYGTSGLGANGIDGKGSMWYNNGTLNIDGIDIFMAKGMPSNTAICTLASNLYFATGTMSDFNQIKVLDMADIDLSDNVRMAIKYLATADYAYAEDIVTYGITNNAN